MIIWLKFAGFCILFSIAQIIIDNLTGFERPKTLVQIWTYDISAFVLGFIAACLWK
jgi:hypothetical protein